MSNERKWEKADCEFSPEKAENIKEKKWEMDADELSHVRRSRKEREEMERSRDDPN